MWKLILYVGTLVANRDVLVSLIFFLRMLFMLVEERKQSNLVKRLVKATSPRE
jgi:hypothetical protein